MNRIRSGIRYAVHATAMVCAVIGLVRCGVDEGDGHDHFDATTALLVRSRDALRACVQVAPGLEPRKDQLVEQLRGSFGVVQQHPSWSTAGFGRGLAEIAASCPAGVVPQEVIDHKSSLVGPGVTDRPTPYRLFVYVVDDATADRVLGDRNVERAPAELMRVGAHELAEVSTALVVRQSFLSHPEFALYWLTWGVGLMPAGGLDSVSSEPAVEKAITEGQDQERVK